MRVYADPLLVFHFPLLQQGARSAAEHGSLDHGSASRAVAGPLASGSRALHGIDDFDDDLLDPRLREGAAASAEESQEDDRGVGGSLSRESPASGGAASAARSTTRQLSTSSGKEGGAHNVDGQEAGEHAGFRPRDWNAASRVAPGSLPGTFAVQKNAADVAPRTLKQQKRTFRAWQRSLGRKVRVIAPQPSRRESRTS